MARHRADVPVDVTVVVKMGEETAGKFRVRDVAAALGIYQQDVHTMFRRGELAATKIGRRWFVDAADLEAVTASRAGLRDLQASLRRIADLEAEVRRLRSTIAHSDDRERLSAIEALSVLSLDECLEILGRIDAPDRTVDVWMAKRAVQQQIDRIDQPAFVGQRPKGTPERAKRHVIGTAIGQVDIWYWQNAAGRWRASVGGPRGEWPGSRQNGHLRLQSALKEAGQIARSRYGKPDRRSTSRLRLQILARDGFTCRYCGAKAPRVELHVDHVIAVADGGGSEADNLVTACRDCNQGKGSRTIMPPALEAEP